MAIEKYIWSEKYAPQTIKDCILTDSLRELLENIVASKDLPNLLFYGPPGVGKTTIAKVLVNELNLIPLFINGSKDSGIDVLRNSIETFVTTKALNNKRKVVILDEADYLQTQSTQPALRSFMDKHQSQCSFIFTCNYPQKLLEPLRSRCTEINFSSLDKEQKGSLMKQCAKKFVDILTNEGVTFTKEALKKVIIDHFPDFRKMVGELQRCSLTRGAVDESLFASNRTSIDELFSFMKNKSYSDVRSWCINSDINLVYTNLYHKVYEYITPEFIPPTIIVLAKYQYQNAFVADKELNLLACLTEIMFDVTFI